MYAPLRIQPVNKTDYEGWLALWNGNNGVAIDPRITLQTWDRLNDPAIPVHGLIAHDGDICCGLVHYILHPVTGHLHNACYMQDLYVLPAYRRRGIGRQMVEMLVERGRAMQWARLYWLAEAGNREAQELYKNLGVKLDFTFHVMPLERGL